MVEVMVVVEVVVAMAVVDVGQGVVAVGAAGAATADAGPARVQLAAIGPVARHAAVHAAARRRARRDRGRWRGGQEGGGGRAWLAQASVQNEFQVVAGTGRGRDRLAAHKGRHPGR